MPQERHRIVIVGGGVAGLLLATRLGRKLGRSGGADITLVDRATAHVWKPMLHTFAAGTSHPYRQKVAFVSHAATNGFRYVPGSLAGVDRNAREIRLAPLLGADGETVLGERKLPYDLLVLAIGSRANDFATPGVKEHCLFIDNLGEAEHFNRRFYGELLRGAEYGRPLTVAIVGGGATGVELAAEISQCLEIAAGYGGGLDLRLSLTLIESSSRILKAFPEHVSEAATDVLRKLGMSVLTHSRVTKADASGVTLKDGGRVEAALRVWAAGVKASAPGDDLSDFERSHGGQILVRPSLQSRTDDRVFAVGDCASLTPEGAERPLPPTAQVARQQAKHLERHLPGWLEGRPIPPFAFREFGNLVALGEYNAFGTLGRRGLFHPRFVDGWFAQLSHALLYRQHQAAIHGIGRASLLWLSGALSAPVRPKIRLD